MTHQFASPTSTKTTFPQSPVDLAQIIELSPVALILIDVNGYIQIWNRGAVSIFGYEAEEIVGRSVYEIFSNILEIIATAGEKLLADTTVVRQELQMQHKSGHTIHVGYSATLLRDANGAVTGTIVSCSDVTQRYRSAEILRAMEDTGKVVLSMRSWDDIFGAITERLRGLGLHALVMLLDETQQNLNMHIVLGDIDEGIKPKLDWATELEERLSQEGGPGAQSKTFSQIRQGGKPIFISDIQTYLPSRLSARTNFLLTKVLGETLVHKAIVAPLWRNEHIIGQLLVAGHLAEPDLPAIAAFANHLSLALANAELWQELEDRVAQRTAELSAQQEQLQTILNNIDDAVVLTDAQERIEFVNPAWEQLNGYKPTEVIGQTLCLIVSSQTPRRTLDELEHFIKSGKPWTGELIQKRKDGHDYEAWMHLAPVFDNAGNIRHYVSVSRDITEEKSAARAKEKFVQDMSHELRTPLTNIKFYLSLLEKQSPNLKSRYMDTLKRETDRLHLLMENLLLLLRLDQGYMQLSMKKEDVRQAVWAITDDCTSRPNNKQIAVHCTLPETPVYAFVDNQLLHRALSNLANNALIYANSQITVAMRQKDENGMAWTGVSITDDGPGIPPEERKQIYKRFFQRDSTPDWQSSGAGIGLSIAQEIASIFGGTIECVNQPQEEGSTFILWLPTSPDKD